MLPKVWRRLGSCGGTNFWGGLLVAWVPSVVVTMAMVRWMALTRQRDSTFGRYVALHMTHLAEAVRFGGQFAMWFGAWFHVAWAIGAGIVVIILGWTYSLPFRGARAREGSR